MKKVIISVLTALSLLMCFTSCEEDSKTYETKISNKCYSELSAFGITVPFSKIRIDEVKFNDEVVATNIAAPSYDGGRTDSEFFSVESGIDYEVKITFTTIFYNSETDIWDTDGVTETYTAGTESWTNDEDHTKFALLFTTGGLSALYRPVFETFYVE